jgi:hypothetical protein
MISSVYSPWGHLEETPRSPSMASIDIDNIICSMVGSSFACWRIEWNSEPPYVRGSIRRGDIWTYWFLISSKLISFNPSLLTLAWALAPNTRMLFDYWKSGIASMLDSEFDWVIVSKGLSLVSILLLIMICKVFFFIWLIAWADEYETSLDPPKMNGIFCLLMQAVIFVESLLRRSI